MEGSVRLPPSGEIKMCPPCNPGMHYTAGQGAVLTLNYVMFKDVLHIL